MIVIGIADHDDPGIVVISRVRDKLWYRIVGICDPDAELE
jgi:hypothetical protein